MPITVNDGGVLRTLGEISVNDGGVLKKLNTVHANDGGVLRQIFSAGTPISNYEVGSVVKIKEDGVAVNYIIVHKGKPSSLYDSSCDGVWLLRETVHSKRAWGGTYNSFDNDYEFSDIKAWLNGTFLNTIDVKIRAAIKTVKIPFKRGTGKDNYGVCSGSSGLSCKAFLLSAYEVDFTQYDDQYVPIDGARLSYFLGNTARIGKDSSGTAVGWWLRSPYAGSTKHVWNVTESGYVVYNQPYYPTLAVRPAFILPNTVKVDNNGNLIV